MAIIPCGFPLSGSQYFTEMALSFRNATMAASRRLLQSQARFLFARESRFVASPLATRSLSDTATTTSASSSQTKDDSKDKKKKKDENSNIFLDNLGKIFLGAIGLLIASLTRSSYSGKNRTKLREELEQQAALDPMEIDDLRVANSELSPEVFRIIMQDLQDTFPQGSATYPEFVKCVRTTMMRLKGDAFTIELGHLMDRAVLDALHQQQRSETEPVPLVFLLAGLSLGLRSSVDDRIAILYETMQTKNPSVTYQDVKAMVGYLQDTSQLEPASQVVEAPTKYPTQQFVRGTPDQLVQWKGSYEDPMDLSAFSDILTSKAVCAWGECYNRKKSRK